MCLIGHTDFLKVDMARKPVYEAYFRHSQGPLASSRAAHFALAWARCTFVLGTDYSVLPQPPCKVTGLKKECHIPRGGAPALLF
jgi:hypothetical protein